MTEKPHKKRDTALLCAIVTTIAMVVIIVFLALGNVAFTAIGKAMDRQDEGQKAYIDRHKLENKGKL